MNTTRWNWTFFCREGFIIWSQKQHDFGLCFQYLCLHIPILFIFGISSAYFFGLQTNVITRNKVQTMALLTRSIISMILTFTPITEIYSNIYLNDETIDNSFLLLGVVQGICWFSHFVYILRLKRGVTKNPRGPMLMSIIWSLLFSLTILSTRSQYLLYRQSNKKSAAQSFGFSCFALILQIAYAVTLIPGEDNTDFNLPRGSNEVSENQPLLSSGTYTYIRFTGVDDPQYLGVAMEHISYISRLFFSWVNTLISKGAKGTITNSEDLYDLPPSISSNNNASQLGKTLDELPSSSWSFIKGLHKCYACEFYSVGILKFIADCCGFAGPILLNRLVSFIENKSEEMVWGYVYAVLLIAATTFAALCDTHFNFLMSLIGLKMRGGIITTIYKKTLSVSSTVLTSNLSVGEIMNFMSTDTDRIVNSCPSFHSLWSIPFQISVALYLLYNQVGIAFLAGVVFTIILIPINKCIANKIGDLSTKMMEQKDARVKMTSEILRGYKPIKLYVWEQHFVSEITKKRDVELKYLKGRKYLDAMCVYFWATTPVIISILTIGTYILFGNKLTAAVVFTTIALLNMLVSPLNAFPWVLNGLTEAWVSLKRIQKLLDLPNMDYDKIYDQTHLFESENNESIEIFIKNGTFYWETNKCSPNNENSVNKSDENVTFKLSDINIKINEGEFIGIIGPVGSGKSSLLATILGELSTQSGSIGIRHIDAGFAIVTQQSWLQRGTIRDNILFGKPYDETKYKSIIFACGLTEDFQELQASDKTEIGDSGGTLSGGQKTRIALARAIYQDKSVYLFDDILSAVDVKVGKHIFHHCIMGLLKDKTRILCTHHLKFLVNADKILLLDNGVFKSTGTPSEVFKNEIKTDLELETDIELVTAPENEVPDINNEDTREEVDKNLFLETSRKGGLELSVCTSYWNGMGHLISISILLTIILMQFSRNITDWWLANEVTIQGDDNTTNTTVFDFDEIPWPLLENNDTKMFLLVYVGFACANTLFTLLRSFIFAYGGIVAAKTFHKKLLRTALQGTCTFFDVTPLGRIINRFSSDTYTIDDSLPFILNILLAQLFGLLGSLIITVYGIPWICIILVPLFPIYTWLLNQYRVTSRELKRISSVTLSPVYNHFSETLQGLMHIRAMRASVRFRRENEENIEANLKAQFASQSAARWLGLRLQFISVAIITGVSFIAVIQHQYDVANPGFIGLAISYALSITSSLAGVINAFTETEREMIAVERVKQYLDTIPSESLHYVMDPPFAWPSQGVVSFTDVVLRYRRDLCPSLRSVSFATRPFEKVGVVGRTGAGKSSLISALFRLVDISEGTIRIDSIDINKISLGSLRSRMFCIPQDPFLFSGSLRDNLDPLGEFTDDELWTSLRKTNLFDTFTILGGLKYYINGSGCNFSLGQKQLICLARAVLRNPKILCIDEATANVDEETDKIIQNTLRTSFRNSTVVTIAHRVQTILDSDRVLVMHQGEVVEFDRPDALMANSDSYFFKLVKNI